MLRNVPHLIWGFVCLLATPVLAQNSALNELYGHGVHAYNSGSYVEAYNLLTRAIDSGSEDPRCYYFRGLSYLKLGREPEARSDFAKAAELEMADTDRFYNVGKSLERVQGRARTLLEQYRSEARLQAFQARENERQRRYQRIRKNEPNVTIPPQTEDVEPPAPEATEPPDVTGPEPPAEMPDEPAEEMPADETPAEEPAASDEPAGDESDKPAEDDPFAEGNKSNDDAKPDEDMPAEESGDGGDKAKADEDDPFAEDESKDGDAKPAEEPADGGDKPEADKPKADGGAKDTDEPAKQP